MKVREEVKAVEDTLAKLRHVAGQMWATLRVNMERGSLAVVAPGDAKEVWSQTQETWRSQLAALGAIHPDAPDCQSDGLCLVVVGEAEVVASTTGGCCDCEPVRQPNGDYVCSKCGDCSFPRDDDPYAHMVPGTDRPACRGCGAGIALGCLLCEKCFDREQRWWTGEPRSSSWRRGSTAPKDGTLILAAWPLGWPDPCVQAVYWERRWWKRSGSRLLAQHDPLWWMPIPPLPEGGES